MQSLSLLKGASKPAGTPPGRGWKDAGTACNLHHSGKLYEGQSFRSQLVVPRSHSRPLWAAFASDATSSCEGPSRAIGLLGQKLNFSDMPCLCLCSVAGCNLENSSVQELIAHRWEPVCLCQGLSSCGPEIGNLSCFAGWGCPESAG